MCKHGDTPSQRDKHVTLAAISSLGVAQGRFVGGRQSGLAGCKPPHLFMRGASSCLSQGRRQEGTMGHLPTTKCTYLPTYCIQCCIGRSECSLKPIFRNMSVLLSLNMWLKAWESMVRVFNCFLTLSNWQSKEDSTVIMGSCTCCAPPRRLIGRIGAARVDILATTDTTSVPQRSTMHEWIKVVHQAVCA